MSAAATEIDALLADPAYPRLKAHVVESTGLAYFVPRDADLVTRLRRRMAAAQSPDCAHYLSLIQSPGGERDALIRELTIGETHFFRFREQFEALRRTVLPELLLRKQHDRRLRIWSAGCASGPEPYSLAILLERELGALLADWQVTILGTDINQDFLQRAREGVYAEWALRGLPDELRRECFTQSAAGWRLSDLYRRRVAFQSHNLVTDAPPTADGGAFDLILCRNVMIYFSPEIIRQVLSGLHTALTPGGWLLVGHAEGNQDWFRDFETVPLPGTVAYRRKSAVPVGDTPTPLWSSHGAPAVLPSLSEPKATAGPVEELMAWRPHPLDQSPVHTSPSNAPCSEAAADIVGELRGLVDRGDWSEALECARRQLARDPLNAQGHFYRGLALFHQGDHAGAEADLRRALYLESDLALAYYHLGLLLVARGDRGGAMKAFRNTLRALRGDADDAPVDGAEELAVARLREAVASQIRSLDS